MTSEWSRYLESLNETHQRLERERYEFICKITASKDDDLCSTSFDVDRTQLGPYVARVFFNWQKHFDLSENSCIYSLKSPYIGLVYHDTIILQIFPVPEESFNKYHCFGVSDFARLNALSKSGRVIFWVTTNPVKYKNLTYLYKLFKDATVAYVPWNIAGIANEKKWEEYNRYEKYVEEYVEKKSIRQVIVNWSKNNHETYELTESELCVPLQDMRLYELFDLEKTAWGLLENDPSLGFEFLGAVRRLLINPIRYGRGVTHSWDKADLENHIAALGKLENVHNIHMPGEIGAVLEDRISLPVPSSWDAVRWCEDHVDLVNIRGCISNLQTQLKNSSLTSSDVEQYQSAIKTLWMENVRTTERNRQIIFWSSTLSLGAAGLLVSGPLIGLLSAFGLTAISNILAEPFSEKASKILNKNSFQIWNLDKTGIPRIRQSVGVVE